MLSHSLTHTHTPVFLNTHTHAHECSSGILVIVPAKRRLTDSLSHTCAHILVEVPLRCVKVALP